MKNSPLSYIELSKGNLIHNIKTLRSVAGKPARNATHNVAGGGVQFAIAIKGNAYGHGQAEVSKILDKYVDVFIVNSIEELRILRKISKKIAYLMGYVQEKDLLEAIKLGCVISIFSLKQILTISAIAKSVKIAQKLNVPIDAHLGREGFLEHEWAEVFETIKKSKNIELVGMYSHFANIEDTTNFTHAKKQIEKYEKAVALAKKFGFDGFLTHISATSGLLVYEKDNNINSLVRVGIGAYGLWPSEHIKFLYSKKLGSRPSTWKSDLQVELKPVLSWKTQIAQVKTLPVGETIGYGLTYMTHTKIKIAVIPQGYADGFGRNLSNKAEVLIGGKRCKILGRVSMNMCVADITRLKNVKEGDEVVLIGKQGKEAISAEEIGQKADTINYEAVTKI